MSLPVGIFIAVLLGYRIFKEIFQESPEQKAAREKAERVACEQAAAEHERQRKHLEAIEVARKEKERPFATTIECFQKEYESYSMISTKCLDKDWHNLKKKDWGDNLEWSDIYPFEIEWFYNNVYTSHFSRGGVYFILNKIESEYQVVYIGQSKSIGGRLCEHLHYAIYHEKSGNPLLKKYLKHSFNRENCHFMFVVVKGQAKRDRIEQDAINKYEPECNRSTGISKRVWRTPAKPHSSTSLMRKFLTRKAGFWGCFASDSQKIVVNAHYPRLPAYEKVIARWDGNVLIIPNNAYDSIDGKNKIVNDWRDKLRVIAVRQRIKIRNV